MLVSDALDEWLSLRLSGLAPRTIESYRSLINRHIGPALGADELAALTAARIQSALLVPLCESGHPRTAQLCLIVLKSLCKEAREEGIINRDPAARIVPPRHTASDPRWWTPEELRQFVIASQASHWALAWQLSLCCGLRRGEIAGLRWQDVDLSGRVLHICNQRQRLEGRGVVDLPPKSASSRRIIPIPDGLLPLLRIHQRAQRARMAQGAVVPVYVISYTDNRPIDPHRLNLELTAAINAAGVRPINVHGLRHTMATLATSCGITLRKLQTLLGHSSSTLTARVYAHVLEPDLIEAANSIADRVL